MVIHHWPNYWFTHARHTGIGYPQMMCHGRGKTKVLAPRSPLDRRAPSHFDAQSAKAWGTRLHGTRKEGEGKLTADRDGAGG